MALGFMSSLIILLYSLFVLQSCVQIIEGHRRIFNGRLIDMKKVDHGDNNHLRFRVNQDENSGKNSPAYTSDLTENPELNVFFYYSDLKIGNKIPIYFPKKDPSITPHLLSKQESDSIPFSSTQFSKILELFSFPEDSKQAKAMKSTLHHCEFPPIKGETKFCATSLEFMLDSIRGMFGPDSKFKVLNTNYLSEPITPLQNYTISETPAEILASKILGCHPLPYPYAVFYCHGQSGDNVVYKVLLAGEDRGKVEAVAMCHMDTSEWDPKHIAFRVLKTRPGASPVCHFFPPDNLVWIPIS